MFLLASLHTGSFYFETPPLAGSTRGRAGFVLENSPRKMAAVGSAEPGPTANAAARSHSSSVLGTGSSSPEDKRKCEGCAETQPVGSPPCGHSAGPARRHSCSEEQHRKRSDRERSSSRPGRRDCDSRRGRFAHRGNFGAVLVFVRTNEQMSGSETGLFWTQKQTDREHRSGL